MARPLVWFVNAFRRTVVACLPVLAAPDDEFAGRYLAPSEYRLYLKMDRRDREHACWLARRLLDRQPEVSPELVRAALLHDVGKSERPYNPIYRIVSHLYSADLPPEPRLAGLRGALQADRHHHRYGAEMIRKVGGSSEVARLVERHHEPGGDSGAALLKRLDDET